MHKVCNRLYLQYLVTHCLEAGKEHPALHRNHTVKAVCLHHCITAFHKHCKQIALAVLIILFHVSRQIAVHAAAAHIRRVRDRHPILLGQQFCRLHDILQLQQGGLFHAVVIGVVYPQFIKSRVQRRPVLRGRRQDRAVLPRVLHLGQYLRHSRRQLGVSVAEHLHRAFVHGVALGDGVDMGLHRVAQKAPVMAAGGHHHRKIGQLRGTLVNVQPVQIVLHDAFHRFPRGVAAICINLHQYVKQIHQNVSAAAAGVDAGQLLRREGGIALAQGRKPRFDLRGLGGVL